MPTGLKFKKLSSINTGGLNIQAVPTMKPTEQTKLVQVGQNINSPELKVAKQNVKVTATQLKTAIPVMAPILGNKTITPANYKTLTLVVTPSDGFDPVELAGITKERPEIIMMTDFLPIFRSQEMKFTAAGKMMDIQIAARNLKIENYAKLKKQLEDNELTKPFIEQIDKRWNKQIKRAKKQSQFLSSMMTRIRRAKSALNIRNTKQLSGKATLKDFFTNELQFTENGFKSFSNSKIMSQFFYDMRVAASIYSPNLFDSKDKDRATDKSPIEIDKTVSLNDGKFAFDIDDFKSSSIKIINMADIKEHKDLVSSLPNDLSDRIKLLLVVLSKEMRVSKGLGSNTLNNTLESTFGGDSSGDPFAHIVGEPGDRIVDIPQGDSSLSSLIRFEGDDGTVVLPFESNFITDENDRTYVPGTTYFVDSILQKTPIFNVSRIRSFKNDFEKKMSDSVQLFNGLLELKESKTKLRAEKLYSQVIQDVGNILDKISETDARSALVLAIFKLANDDMELKSMLFQFMLLLALKKGVIGDDIVVEPFKLARSVELRRFSAFSRVITSLAPLTDDSETDEQAKVFAAMTQLAERIASRIFKFVASTKPSTPDLSNNSSFLILQKESIQNALLDSESNTPLVTIIKFITRLEELATDRAIIQDNTGRTRFNFFSITTRAALAFEIYSAMYTQYTHNSYFSVTATTIRHATDFDKTKLNSFIFKYAADEVSRLANKPRTGLATQIISGEPLQQQQGKTPKNLQTVNNYSFQEILETLGIAGGIVAIVIFTTLNDVARKVIEEDNRMRDFVGLLRQILRRVKNQTNKLVKFFDINGENKEDLAEFTTEEDVKEKAAMLNEAQVNLALAEIDDMEHDNLFASSLPADPNDPLKGVKKNAEVKFTTQFKPFLDDSDISPRIRQGMLDLFSRKKYRDKFSSDLKILTVGIPSGFMDNLRGRVDVDDDEPDTFEPIEGDIISIDVYKRDLELEDIIFKPKQYIFEMSRFIARRRFARGTKNILSSPWTIQKNFSARTGKFGRDGDISDDPSYGFLNINDRRELMENHVISYLLGVYLKVMTGVSTSEIDYLANKQITTNPFDETTRQIFRDLVNTHISGIVGKTITLDMLAAQNPQIANLVSKINDLESVNSAVEQINNVAIRNVEESAAIEVTQDIINFMTLFSPNSFIAGASSRRKKALSPKLFERIFNIPVDPGEFEIDQQATNATQFGKQSLKNLLISKRIRRVTRNDGTVSMYAVPKTKRDNSVVYEEFFVTISTVGGHTI